MWNGKGTTLKSNQKPKIEQKTKSQIFKIKENKKRSGLVLEFLLAYQHADSMVASIL